ncbi:MAG: PKD domain-containing protein [Acidobacteriota bacterium]
MLKPFLSLTLLISLASSAAAQELFLSQKALSVPSSSVALLENQVAIDLSLLQQPSAKIILDLPDGNRYEVLSTGFEQRLDGGTTWRGEVPWQGLEMPAGVTLTVHDSLVVGTISTPDGTYEIRPQADRSHRLAKVDRSHLPDCAGGVQPEVAYEASQAPLATLPAIDSSTAATELTGIPQKASSIDVLAIYSSGARNLRGGHSQIRALIQHAVDFANSSFGNSATSPRVVLRHAEEMAISQSNWHDLGFLRQHGPTQALRNEVGADLVAAFIHDVDGFCGQGYLMNPVGVGFAPWGYSVNLVECDISVAAHEFGHNLGLHHDPANAGSNPAFAWAYGHFVDLRFRTIMSYSAECTNRNCPRIPNFSHPGISFQGLPTGIANQRHNARVLNVTGSVVAAFRAPQSIFEAAFTYTPSPPAVDAPVTFTDQSTGSPNTWSWTFGDGSSSSARNPTHTYSEPGTYTVRLTSSRGAQSDTSSTEIVVEDVAASFDVAPVSPRVNLPVQFSDTSTGAPDTWAWSFGDGATSIEADPTHTYAEPGTYAVDLTVSRGERVDTITTEIEIRDRTCASGDNILCLAQDRFEVEVEWTDFQNQTGRGTVAPQGSDDSGLFWFFNGANLEMLVKVLDGCGLNDHFWVFAAATTDVAYTLRVTDTYAGEVREFTNPLGVASDSITDTAAFDTCGATAPAATTTLAGRTPVTPREPEPASVSSLAGVGSLPLPIGSDCQAGESSLCLNGERFKVEVDWRDFQGQTGTGSTVFNLEDSGLFWFFSPNNWELLVKVLDGCGLNDHYWVFAAATTDVEYTLRVTDMVTGEVSQYTNQLGVAAPAITDTQAFASCSQ